MTTSRPCAAQEVASHAIDRRRGGSSARRAAACSAESRPRTGSGPARRGAAGRPTRSAASGPSTRSGRPRFAQIRAARFPRRNRRGHGSDFELPVAAYQGLVVGCLGQLHFDSGDLRDRRSGPEGTRSGPSRDVQVAGTRVLGQVSGRPAPLDPARRAARSLRPAPAAPTSYPRRFAQQGRSGLRAGSAAWSARAGSARPHAAPNRWRRS